MKRVLSLAICIFMLFAMTTAINAEAGEFQPAGNSTAEKESSVEFQSVDLSGIKSIELSVTEFSEATCILKADNPKSGAVLAYLRICDSDELNYAININAIEGVHSIYVVPLYGKVKVEKLTTSKSEATNKYIITGDDSIVDTFRDTWTASDELGRRVADYEEAGAIKEGSHEVGIMYWESRENTLYNARIPSEIAKAYPDKKDDYLSNVWDTNGTYFWSEPLFGFYNTSYWIYRRHAVMLANAGIDVVFFDWSNGDDIHIKALNTLCRAFADAKESGVRVPKINALTSWYIDNSFRRRQLINIYTQFFKNERYKDLWYCWDGKPLIFGNSSKWSIDVSKATDDELVILNEIFENCTFRESGSRKLCEEENGDRYWHWLQNYPLTKWNKENDGRTEFMVVGTAINESYVDNTKTGVFSDPYTKGRSYTEAFGEDYREDAMNMGYFFREQSSQALREDPAFMMVNGWNEWVAVRNAMYSGYTNSFVDTYDNEGSRDFEPSAGKLRDDYYNMLCDFVRKYKGVRPAPIASAEKTIDISGDISQWNDVLPAFVNDYTGYERNDIGLKNPDTGKNYQFVTAVPNVITGAKVARDTNTLYFLIKAENKFSDNAEKLHLYIDTDRNHATGWEGFDFSVNVTGKAELAEFSGEWKRIAEVSMNISGNCVTIAIPRAVISETGEVDFEFKIADSAEENGNILRFYEYGSVAPMGRFNYLYIEKEQTALTEAERSALSDVSVLKAGSPKMVVSGGKMNVYDPDTRITAFTENGTLYVPESAVEEILGFGETKCAYYKEDDTLYISNHDLEGVEITKYIWSYTVPGSLEARRNGRLLAITNPVKSVNGLRYVPLTYLSEVFNWQIKDLGNGCFAISSHSIDADAAACAAAHI